MKIATANETDAWGRKIMLPGDGHGAWNCNNYECSEHPASLYGGAKSEPETVEAPVSLPVSGYPTFEILATNFWALATVVTKQYGATLHGDDAEGRVDVEFPNLRVAAAFVGILRPEIVAETVLRETTSFVSPVVVTIPLPNDRDLFGVRG